MKKLETTIRPDEMLGTVYVITFLRAEDMVVRKSPGVQLSHNSTKFRASVLCQALFNTLLRTRVRVGDLRLLPKKQTSSNRL